MKKIWLIFILTITIFEFSTAQTIAVSGSVKNEKGEALPFVLVMSKDANAGIYTDSLGHFNIRINPGASIQFSLKGFSDTSIEVEKNSNLAVTLKYSGNKKNGNNVGPSNSGINSSVADAFSGHTYLNSNLNTGTSDADFDNGASFHVSEQKENTHGSRYYFKDWTAGQVINSKGQVIQNPSYLFNYDKIAGELLLTHDKENAIIVDNDQIKSFTLYDENKEPLIFEKVPSIDADHYLQVIADGDKYKILKLTKTKFIPSSFITNGLTSSGNPYDEYVDENAYYVLDVLNNHAQQFSLKKKSIKEIFETAKNKVDSYFDKHKGTIDDQFLKSLGDFMNS